MTFGVRRAPMGLVAVAAGLAAIVFVAGVAAIVAEEDELPTAGRQVRVEGAAIVERADGSRTSLTNGDVVRPGDVVEVNRGITALELAGGGTVEGREGRGTVDDTRFEVGAPVRLLAGDALASGPAGVAVEAAGTIVTLRSIGVDSAARIRRELAVTTATYQGSTAVDSAGQRRDVPALRQLSVASVGRPPTEAGPLRFDESDPWDLRFLGGAIALSRSLDALSLTFTAQGVPRTAPDFEALLPRLADEPSFDSTDLVRARPAGEVLVGAAIAVLGNADTFDQRWDEVFSFRDDGAAWGLVAFDQGVLDGPVLADIDQALALSVLPPPVDEVAAPAPTLPPVIPTPVTTAESTEPLDGTTSTSTPEDAPPPTPAPDPLLPTPGLPTVPPISPQQPVPDTGSGLLDGLLKPVNDLLGGLLGG